MTAWIKIPVGVEVGLGPGDCVRWGRHSPLQEGGGTPPPKKKIGRVYCGQTAGLIKMVLGTEVGLSTGDFVLDGDPAPSPQNWPKPSSAIFGPFLLRTNGWMHQDAT